MKKSMLVLAVFLSLLSCRKSGMNPIEPPVVQEKVADYFPMTDGSYWIYRQYNADSSLIFSESNDFDSVAIDKDTLIRGILYKKISSSFLGPVFMRDSSGYLINDWGAKFFTVNKDTSVLRIEYPIAPDSSLVLTAVMQNSDSISVVPAGQFMAKYVLGTLTSIGLTSAWSGQRNLFNSYSKNVGKVCRRLAWAYQGTYIEERLVRYRVVGNQTP